MLIYYQVVVLWLTLYLIPLNTVFKGELEIYFSIKQL